ncbi:hypothetical protein ACH3XW_28495 [Acanthocheilonema viteae]
MHLYWKTNSEGRRAKLKNQTIESNIKTDKEDVEGMQHCFVADQRHHYSNQQQNYAIGQQMTPKWGFKHVEMPSLDFHAVVLEVAKKKKDKVACLINDDKMAEQQHQHSNENNRGPSNFINYRRRVVDASDAKTCALLMTKIKEATRSSQ